MKPSIPKGTRDFSPTEVANRTYIMNTIKTAFETFGFQPIETPSFENSSTLMGKYGEEGDRLIFKILNSGDFLKDVEVTSTYIKYIFRKCLEHSFLLFYSEKYEKFYSSEEANFNEIVDCFEYYLYKDQLFESTFKDIIDTRIKSEFLALKKYLGYAIFKYADKIFNEKRNLFEIASIFGKVTERSIFKNLFIEYNYKRVAGQISEKALRYDLTVPFARYVVQHQNEITFPFKRYQVQPVWRADRPQKGRFREFYQCDADVVGSKSLWQEVEFIQLYDTVFSKLGLAGTTIKMNNRKILSGIAEVIGAQDKLIDFTVALDKLDKIGQQKVEAEMLAKGISEEAIQKVQPLFSFDGTNEENLDALATLLATSEEGLKGVEELRFVIKSIAELGLQTATLEIDVTLARGLNYYTGAIFEVSAPKGVKMGSIGGGGRYDDLTGIFGMKDVSGVGISFGLDRIYLVLEELGLFKSVDLPKPKVLFINFGETEGLYCMKAISQLRANGIKSELYPDASKMKKQMNYANKREIEFVVMAGSSEIENQTYTLKNMVSGEQNSLNLKDLITTLTK